MKRTIAAALLAAFSLFALMGMGGKAEEPKASPAAVSSGPQFGVVKMADIYQESKVGKAAVAYLDELQKDAMGKMETMQADLTKAREAGDEAQVHRLEVEMQGAAYILQSVLGAEQDKVIELISNSLNKTLEDYRAQNGLLAIFNAESMQVYAPEADVTKAVLALYDKTEVTFGPKPSLDFPVEPEGAANAPADAPASAPAEAPAASQAPANASANAPVETPAAQ